MPMYQKLVAASYKEHNELYKWFSCKIYKMSSETPYQRRIKKILGFQTESKNIISKR